MIKWLQNYAGITDTGGNADQAELEKLRKEVDRLHKKYPVEAYMVPKEEEPENSENENEQDKSFSSSSSEALNIEITPQEQEEIDREMEQKVKVQRKKGNRLSVSAESYGEYNKKGNFVPRCIKKTEEEKKTIMDKCGQSFIFNSLEDNELTTVINAFEKKEYKAGETVIQQGDEGDVIYLVDQGELDCEKVFKPGNPPTHLKVYHPGESFGELALLYNAPRAATIRAKTDSVLWALDRQCFNHIVKDAAMKKRERNENILKRVELLSTIDQFELGQIADALKSKKVGANTEIIKQGEEGNEFYILEEGKAYAMKVIEPGSEPEKVFNYESGGFFGELALLNNAPRAASVVAETDCKLLYLERNAFKRLLGPLQDLLKRNSEKYIKYVQNN